MTCAVFEYECPAGFAALLREELALPGEFHRYVELHADEPFAFLLDSASRLPGLGRYSFLGGAPWLVYQARRSPSDDAMAAIELSYALADGSRRVEHVLAEPFAHLQQTLDQIALPSTLRAQQPLPFVGGAVGSIGYDAKRFIEKLPDIAARDLDLPEICMMFVDQVLAHDHETHSTRLLTNFRAATRAGALNGAQAAHARYLKRIAEFVPAPSLQLSAADVAVSVHAHASERDYMATVERAREHILAGDVFEVCTSQRLDAAVSGDGWRLYECLRRVNPAPFASYLRFPELSLVSSSPERFLRLSSDGRAESRPIKGTRPRGTTEVEDAALRAELLASPKDRAENVMIVDLVRNDFGRVCAVDSIEVPELLIVEAHPSVFQMVSTVRGLLEPNVCALALFRACFPPGSMTGAPKIEAMKIIEALESSKREIYAGSVGYLDVGGGMDWSVVIRSFVVTAGRAHFSVGGAVVADSDPRAEYLESMHKARALLDALAAHARIARP